jgi:hypothetical protein
MTRLIVWIAVSRISLIYNWLSTGSISSVMRVRAFPQQAYWIPVPHNVWHPFCKPEESENHWRKPTGAKKRTG